MYVWAPNYSYRNIIRVFRMSCSYYSTANCNTTNANNAVSSWCTHRCNIRRGHRCIAKFRDSATHSLDFFSIKVAVLVLRAYTAFFFFFFLLCSAGGAVECSTRGRGSKRPRKYEWARSRMRLGWDDFQDSRLQQGKIPNTQPSSDICNCISGHNIVYHVKSNHSTTGKCGQWNFR